MSGEDVCRAYFIPEMEALNSLLTECVYLHDQLYDLRTQRFDLESLIPEGAVSLMPITDPPLPLPVPVSSSDLESINNAQRIYSAYRSQVRIMIDQHVEEIQVLQAELNRLGLNTTM